ncbi:MAG: glycosyltransferase family 39 protein, partial [Abitibacteriaceae bacterium]|nr:glycosyltransferase family 39 protein [Abditibacteriaceae bacterium]
MAKKSNKKKTSAGVNTASSRNLAEESASAANGYGSGTNGSGVTPTVVSPEPPPYATNGTREPQERRRSGPRRGDSARDNEVIEAINPEPEAAQPGAAWTPSDPRYWQVAMGLLMFGIALRQFQLAAFPYSHDESIHAWFAENFQDYKFDPIYHGPLMYHLIAAIYAVLGKSDFSARLAPSLLGIGSLILVLVGTRRWLGPRGTLWTLGLLTISPVMVTYHRRLIHDSLALLLTLGAVLCFQATREHPSNTAKGCEARLGLVACLTLFITTKANAFFIIAMLASFWVAMRAQRWWRSRQDLMGGTDAPSGNAAITWLKANLPLLIMIVVGITSYFAFRDPVALQAAHNYGGFMALATDEHVFSRICALLMLVLWLWLVAAPREGKGVTAPSNDAPAGAKKRKGKSVKSNDPIWIDSIEAEAIRSRSRGFSLGTYLMSAYLSLFLFAFFFGHGYLWWKVPQQMVQDPHEWYASYQRSTAEIRQVARNGASLGLHFVGQHFSPPADGSQLIWSPDPALFKQAQDWGDVVDAMPKMLGYWVGQQNAPRLAGRDDYYIVLMLLYELPIVIAALCGIVRASRERTPFTDLLIWWAITSFALYSIANEKVPWLLSHVMLPFILLAGWWLAQLNFKIKEAKGAFVGVCALGALFLLRGVSATNF